MDWLVIIAWGKDGIQNLDKVLLPLEKLVYLKLVCSEWCLLILFSWVCAFWVFLKSLVLFERDHEGFMSGNGPWWSVNTFEASLFKVSLFQGLLDVTVLHWYLHGVICCGPDSFHWLNLHHTVPEMCIGSVCNSLWYRNTSGARQAF